MKFQTEKKSIGWLISNWLLRSLGLWANFKQTPIIIAIIVIIIIIVITMIIIITIISIFIIMIVINIIIINIDLGFIYKYSCSSPYKLKKI